MKIIKNPNIEIYEEITNAVKENDGYCPCALTRSEETKCICKKFLEEPNCGECHCGRYVKIGE